MFSDRHLGQSADPTAIAVLQHVRGVMDGPQQSRAASRTERAHPGEGGASDVRHLERLPLGMPYDLMARPPLGGHDGVTPATLVLDSTGVGTRSRTSSMPRSCHTCGF